MGCSVSEPRQRYTVSPTKPTKPPTGPAPTPPPGPTINNEPLSTKQLQELITSHAMTIDSLLGEIAKRDNDIKVLEFAVDKGLDRIVELEEKLK